MSIRFHCPMCTVVLCLPLTDSYVDSWAGFFFFLFFLFFLAMVCAVCMCVMRVFVCALRRNSKHNNFSILAHFAGITARHFTVFFLHSLGMNCSHDAIFANRTKQLHLAISEDFLQIISLLFKSECSCKTPSYFLCTKKNVVWLSFAGIAMCVCDEQKITHTHAHAHMYMCVCVCIEMTRMQSGNTK